MFIYYILEEQPFPPDLLVVYSNCDFFALIPSPVLTQSLNLLRILLNSMNSLLNEDIFYLIPD